MKNRVLWFGVLLMALGGIAFVQGQALPRLAVVEFSSNVSTEKAKADSQTVRNLVESQMVATGKYQIVTRSEIDQLLNNQKIAVSDISSAENVKKLQLQNISYIVTGSVDAMGGDYAVTVKILDVSTGQFGHSANDFMSGSSRDLYTGVNTLVDKFVKGMLSEGGQVTSAGGGSGYKIGDTGPGGGIVFAVEGNGGMEVSRSLGDHKWQEAIDIAKNYRGGGFSDWRLPGKDELNLIYQNLQKAWVVNLGSDRYWSSSENDGSSAWAQYFSSGVQQLNYGGKHHTYSVRAVRAF
jgi:TolB-like protein